MRKKSDYFYFCDRLQMVNRIFSAFLTFFLRRVSHFKGRRMKIYSDFLGRLIRANIQ